MYDLASGGISYGYKLVDVWQTGVRHLLTISPQVERSERKAFTWSVTSVDVSG